MRILRISLSRISFPSTRLSRQYPSARRLSMSANQFGDGKPSPPLYQLVDIGANLTSGKYGRELDEVIQRAADCGVFKIMVTGSSIDCSKDGKKHFLYYFPHK